MNALEVAAEIVFGGGSALRGVTTMAIDMNDAKLAIAAKAGAKHLVHTGRAQVVV